MNVGGVEKSFLSLLSTIPKEKYDITLLLLNKKGGLLNQVPNWVSIEEVMWYERVKPVITQPPQKTVIDYVKNREILKVSSFISTYFLSKKLNDRYIYYSHIFKDIPNYSKQFDVAIAYQGPTDIIDFYIAKKVNANKKITWIHFDVEKHKINKKLYVKLHKQFNKVVVVSDGARNKLLNLFPNNKNKTVVFSNIISPKLINKMSNEQIESDENFEGIKIVTVGRLSKEKGQDMAIKVLSKLKNDGFRVKWYCIGEGSARSDYEQLIKRYNLQQYFILLGTKINPYPYIRFADIYVQPSRHEGFCLTLAEAKYLYKPIVTTNFTGVNEQIDNGLNGLIVDGKVDELYEQVKYLIENPKRREYLTNNLINGNMDSTPHEEVWKSFHNLYEEGAS
ncbi:glycosyltransferase [Virgibacillus sp. JSM 102003]|uniref:glycosyltransferase n=1 Tax=Virgibacillus sp. JSM 102003 TaxID=1562108 RepID=UPI0035C058E2